MPTPRARRADDIDRAAAAITGRDAACRVGNGKIADALFVVAFLFFTQKHSHQEEPRLRVDRGCCSNRHRAVV